MFKPGNPGCGCCDESSNSSSEIIPSCADGIRYGLSLEISGGTDCTDYAGNLQEWSTLNGFYIWEYPSLSTTINYFSGDLPLFTYPGSSCLFAGFTLRIAYRVRCFNNVFTLDRTYVSIHYASLSGFKTIGTDTAMPALGWDFSLNINDACAISYPPCVYSAFSVSIKWRYLEI